MKPTLFKLQPDYLGDDVIELRPLKGSEFDELYSVAADPLIWELHPSPDRYKREIFKQFFDGATASKSAVLIFERGTGQLIGTSRFYDYNPDERSIAIGYTFLARKYWGGWYNQSLKTLMLNYAFQYVEAVYFHIGASNYRSQKAVEKLGATKVREFIFEQSPSKSLYFEYVINKEEWIPNKIRFSYRSTIS